MTKSTYRNVLIVGDGAKYAEIDGELVQLVSRSATDRLRDGDRKTLVVTTDENGERCADLVWP